MRNEAVEARDRNGVGLCVEFIWREDRYRHTISLIDGDGSIVPLLESFEGVSEGDWPPSPPLQTLTFEELPDGRRVALLLGMAGRSHWSVSIEPLAGEAKIVVDVACRHSTKPASLGSHFRRPALSSGQTLQVGSENAQVLDRGEMVEIMPRTIVAQGTTRWRYVLSAVATAEPH
jgi:hypothetical protein